MRTAFLAFILFLFADGLFAQNGKVYSGTVSDGKNGELLVSVICKALDGNGNIAAYKLTDTKGRFVLTESGKAFSSLTFEYLGYKAKNVSVGEIGDPNNIKIRLEESTFDLQEVVIKTAPIQRTNDTLRYNVANFQGQEDRYLADVLKKLPGVDVREDGTITYQGDAINKFYIEGHDLLGGRYGIATNNMPIDAISQVQVIENNQHIKALKDISYTERAGLNIKLKNSYLYKPFGEIKAGVGMSPFLYNGRIFATQIGSLIQSIATVKGNNTGEDLANEVKDKISLTDGGISELQPDNLIVHSSMQNLPINSYRYLFNNSLIGTLNSLLAISRDTELKANITYLKNRTKQDFERQDVYATSDEPLTVTEFSNQINRNSFKSAALILEHNSSHYFLKDELKGSIGDARNSETIIADLLTNKPNYNKPATIQNSLSGLARYSNNKTVRINSFFRYFNNKESMSLLQSDDILLDEQVRGKHISTNNSLSSSFSIGRQRFGISAAFNYKSADIDVEMPVIDLPNLLPDYFPGKRSFNSLTETYNSEIRITSQIKKGERWTINLSLPVVFYNIKSQNEQTKRTNETDVVFIPSLTNTLKLNYRWETSATVGYNVNFGGNDIMLMDNSFFRSHRTLYIPSGIIPVRKDYSASGRLKYSNLADMLFGNLSIVYRKYSSNNISRTVYTTNFAYTTTERTNNEGTMFLTTSEITKSFASAGVAITLTPQYNQMRGVFIQQDQFVYNRANVASLALKTDIKSLKKFYFEYKTSGTAIWNDNTLTDKRILKSLQQRLVINYFPAKNLDFSLNGDHSLLETAKDKYSSYMFIDLRGRHKFKTVELELVVNNIFDNAFYSIMNLSTVNSMYQQFPLRGREFLLSARMSF